MTIAAEPTEQRTEHDGVQNLRRGLLWVCVATAAAVLALCSIAIVVDLADHTDDWDGLMVMLAVIVGLPCLVIGTCATWAVRSRVPRCGRHHGGADVRLRGADPRPDLLGCRSAAARRRPSRDALRDPRMHPIDSGG